MQLSASFPRTFLQKSIKHPDIRRFFAEFSQNLIENLHTGLTGHAPEVI
jgi:hypothetical protein